MRCLVCLSKAQAGHASTQVQTGALAPLALNHHLPCRQAQHARHSALSTAQQATPGCRGRAAPSRGPLLAATRGRGPGWGGPGWGGLGIGMWECTPTRVEGWRWRGWMVCWEELLCAWLLVPGRTQLREQEAHAGMPVAHVHTPARAAIPYGAPPGIRAPSAYALKPPCRQRLRLHKQTSAALGLKSVSGWGPCPAVRCRCTFTIASAGARGAAATNRTRGCCCSRPAHALRHGEEASARWRVGGSCASARGRWGIGCVFTLLVAHYAAGTAPASAPASRAPGLLAAPLQAASPSSHCMIGPRPRPYAALRPRASWMG